MYINFIDNPSEIREDFIKRFVLPWEKFRVENEKWITEMAQSGYPIDRKWYDQSYMWDRRNSEFRCVSMRAALDFLCKHSGNLYFMSEADEETYIGETRYVNFVGCAEANELAKRIEFEWYNGYELAQKNMYDANAYLPEDLYVFNSSMEWCVVFTHETTDWESELVNPMKAAESRVCFIASPEGYEL